MRKLLSMWEGIFPQQLLSILKQKTEQPALMQSSGPRRIDPAVQYQSSQWSRSQGSIHQPVSSSGRNGYPTESHTYQSGRPMSALYQHPQYAYQHSASLQPPGMGVQNTSAPTGTWHQQQGARAQFAVTQQPSSQPLVLPHLLSSLLSSGLLTVPESVSIAPPAPQAAGPAVYYTHSPSRAATPEAVSAEGCNFVPSRLKVLSLSLCKLLQLHASVVLCCRCWLHLAFACKLLCCIVPVGHTVVHVKSGCAWCYLGICICVEMLLVYYVMKL